MGKAKMMGLSLSAIALLATGWLLVQRLSEFLRMEARRSVVELVCETTGLQATDLLYCGGIFRRESVVLYELCREGDITNRFERVDDQFQKRDFLKISKNLLLRFDGGVKAEELHEVFIKRCETFTMLIVATSAKKYLLYFGGQAL